MEPFMPAFNARPGRGPGDSQRASSDPNAATDAAASAHPTPPDGTATAARARASAKPAVPIGMLRSVHNGLVLEAASEAAGSKKGRG